MDLRHGGRVALSALLVACSGKDGAAATGASGSETDAVSSSTTADPGSEAPPALLGDDCPENWAGGDVVGEAAIGGLTGTTALFAYIRCQDTSQGPDAFAARILTLRIFDASVDYATATSGAGNRLEIDTSWYWHAGGWLRDDYATGLLYVDGDHVVLPVKVDVQAMAGDWQTFDPEDPPRLVGAIMSDDPSGPQGSFDAAFCGALVEAWCPD